MDTAIATTRASSSGKVLILGGYLIVEAPNVGISVGTTARFETRLLKTRDAAKGKCCVRIHSPQFGKEFAFECTVESTPETAVCVAQIEGTHSPFLRYSVLYTVAAAISQGGNVFKELTLELLADNDFYSQRNYLESQGKEVTAANLRLLPPHLPLVGDVSKTGLGSSAAMTTSMVACLYRSLTAQSTSDNNKNNNAAKTDTSAEKEIVHRVAQVAHSVAQGKIGSGFDVYTAAYGTCAYRRFPAKFVESVMSTNESPSNVVVSTLADCVNMEKEWVKRVPFHLPLGLKLLLGDVHQGGSGTPGMVSKVMAWRNSVADNPYNLWEQLRENNEKYVASLKALILQAEEKTVEHVNSVDVLKHVVLAQHIPQNDAERLWVEAATYASKSRRYLREMGQAASVEIEPNKLTALLDATCAIPGVFAVGCPGAGGYDAVFALVFGDETCTSVESFWEEYTAMRVCPLLVREDAAGLLFSEEK
ncbi:putative phosphomevalonate kinase protein [Trypanosoma cruzi]|uniref:phosphomevalonate kinase n=5 Tax=Trypanosoma cruzi TaxID=5693 RepID=Q4CQ47_TRYCC|nr:phosphomevalonate kinase-like protein, putative [Trypanosoma cruzi]EAN82398.1 phosphomevalonate kinase-like protein, putative [Trypanosoma cruzi]PWV04187.1 putative phosphomevalonate kinase protein [Trypanosoma cruzi]|eukprot:XP_804249.1 phosphomevalonate kinase-like protein [Trypanosoma cruzi strain CL Brener]